MALIRRTLIQLGIKAMLIIGKINEVIVSVPSGGNKPRYKENMIINIKANQKLGTHTPIKQKKRTANLAIYPYIMKKVYQAG